ncbi:hypothetical protein [Paraglaciecola arctica]|uniref:Uncharacterized protein n=1 Tax=Paraglaciecola arctica BSs20135 TaxID=493475 RepID=K6X8Y9_9ALTE|nr:hypothetical protein [Paraglaciecola arctica]GAC17099.1 hypothetical protein GARC_0117 [Paraglaciecola arctica BSs20135]
MNKVLQFYRKYWILRWLWWLSVVLPGVSFVLVSLGFLLIMHWPKDYQDVINIALDPEVEYLTLSAHGVKDTTASWSDELQRTYSELQHLPFSDLKKQHISFSWQPYSDNVFNCSVDGKNIGFKLGEKIAQLPKIKGVHLVGHSCGSFVILGVCEALKENKASISVQTTYLDPVSVYSGVFWDYGIKYFGSCADFSDAYIDTQDTVPGSNQALRNAYTFDVTQTRVKNNIDYAPHAWPTMFYIKALKKKQLPIYYKATNNLSSGYQKNTLMTWPLEY